MPGLSAPAIKNKLALRCSLTGSVFMDKVQVGKDALLPNGKGLGAPFSCLNSARCVAYLREYIDFMNSTTGIAIRVASNLILKIWYLMGRHRRP